MITMVADPKKPESSRDISWTTAQILDATGGRLLYGNPDTVFSGIAIDSRSIKEDELFVAIKGDTFDGHDFIKDVVNKGVQGCVISARGAGAIDSSRSNETQTVFITVPDTFRALGDLAYYQRKNMHASVVGITGSNGKTSTRAMTASIVSQQFNTLSTRGNFNNEIGLPLTLFNLTAAHEWAILELGMNRPGEIKRLAEICRPDIGVITNIGPAHLEGLGSMEGVMHAKGELLETLPSHGTAILNADDPMTPHLLKKTIADVSLFGVSEKADIRADTIIEDPHGVRFSLQLPDQEIRIELNVPGRFMVSNALAAAAVGYRLGISPERIKKGLENYTPVPGRMHVITTENNIHIIDDTYNSNPGSMAAAIRTLHTLRKDSRAAVIAGDMNELGDASRVSHKQIGSLSETSGVDKLCITGQFADDMAEGAREAGMDRTKIFIGSKEDIIHHLIHWLKPNDWILVKGSRTVGMETVVSGLQKHFNRR